jgi:hypothetical protein
LPLSSIDVILAYRGEGGREAGLGFGDWRRVAWAGMV